ncbi:MAG: hypothetical protein Q4G08_03015 [Capnocytophaga sp.]|nr:hypothetical protein [Capnocytophaga sp.]
MDTKKQKTEKKAATKPAVEKKYYDPETGERISKTGYYMRKLKAEGGFVKILDMRAVLK